MNAFLWLLDQPLAHRLGWTLLHSIWEGAIGAGIFVVVRLGSRRWSANARYLAACLMLALLVVAPVVTLIRMPTASLAPSRSNTKTHQVIGGEAGADLGSVAQPASISIPTTTQYWFRGTEQLDRSLPWTVPLWMLGVIGLSCRWLHGSQWIRRVKKLEIESLDPEWLFRLEVLCEKLEIGRTVKLFKSALVEVPLVVGWLRPVILLPASALVGLTPDQLESILAHELAHVRRYDYLVNTFQNLVETLMFYHPAVWWISKCIREEREHCCDDLVVRVCGDRVSYVRALVTLEEARGFPHLALAATGGSLLHRVRRLLGVSNEGCPPSAAEFGGITLVAIGCVLIFIAIWLFNCPAIYQAAALIKVNPAAALQTVPLEPGGSGSLYPYFLQTECLVIRSPAVLDRVIHSLGREESQRLGGTDEPPSSAHVLRVLRTRLNLMPVPSTSVIEIQATDSAPAEAARLANAVAGAYKEYRTEERRKSISDELDGLEARFKERVQTVRNAADEVDRLRVRLKVPDPDLSESAATMRLSAETLRHIEALRIEAQSEYVKQKALLDRLESLDPKDLPEMIQTVGISDRQLGNYLESLALVDEKLVSMRNEFGPEHPEILKAQAQDLDLRERVAARTTGILKGLQAKLDSTGEGLASLSNAVLNAQTSDIDQAKRFQPYFAAKRDLEELERFNTILQTKIAMERTDAQLAEHDVQIVEEAAAPTQAIVPNRPRATGLLGVGFILIAIGWLLARIGPPSIMKALPA